MEKNYYLGLDLGSNSVGWAATDEDYNFLRLKGKTAWGARIFSEAKDCKERRTYRSNKRRLARRKYRLVLLKQLFAEEMTKVDKTFFLRLANSTYWEEDKAKDSDGNEIGKNLIFKTHDEEKQYYTKYPTIWHLRKALIENDEEALSNLRYVYLAIHHIVKYRGNFLTEGEMGNDIPPITTIEEINQTLSLLEVDSSEDAKDKTTYIKPESYNELFTILENNNLNKVKKQQEIDKLFISSKERSENIKNYINLFKTIIVGGSFSLKKINEDTEDISVDFTKDFENSEADISKALGDAFNLVLIAKKYYDYIILKELLGKNKEISEAMVQIYEEHKEDLKSLKTILKDLDNNLGNDGKDRIYYSVFKQEPTEKFKETNYLSFVQGGKLEELNKYIKKILENNEKDIDDKETYNALYEKACKGDLFKKQANACTSLIPHQFHLRELKKILENAGKKYPFLNDISDKIIKIFKFRVPYYYGPLNNESDAHSWVVKKEGQEKAKITPWNINEIIDTPKTRDNFFKKLTNSCTYLVGETVLPKTSLYYEKYLVLDRLNKMQVNGDYLSASEKNDVLNFILSRKTTTIEQIRTYFSKTRSTKANDISISNIKATDPFNAVSHAFYGKHLDLNNSKNINLCEELIKFATIYADDKKELKKFVSSNFNLTDEFIKEYLNTPTNKWGRLSKKFLCGGDQLEMYYVDDNGILHSILNILEETNENLQEILNNEKYGFNQKIADFNNTLTADKTTEEQIEDILDSTPALMRRSIIQTLAVVDDVIKAAGKAPQKIMMEVTRTDGKKEETKSRYVQLKKQITNDKVLTSDEKKELLTNLENKKIQLKGKHIYLYFMQMGIDFYTGKIMDINDVINGKYDIDHIIPQSMIKDDSLDNMVLVSKDYNQKVKKDIYPICDEIRNNMLDKWKGYYARKIISEEKYNRLKRTKELNADEINAFINRQINVVNYSNIQIKRIFEIKYPETKIIFSKASFPSLLRKEYEIEKMRDLNDAHHAVDAYLNIVCGNILTTLYTDIFYMFKEKKEDHKNISFNMEKRLINYIDKNNLKDKIKTSCLRHDALITYKPDYDSGKFYKETIFKKSGDKETGLIPLHTKGPMSNTKKYGGYSSFSQSYIIAVEYKLKNKTVKKLCRVPTLYLKQYNNDLNTIAKIMIDDEKATDIKVLRKIYLNQKIKYNGCYYLIYTANENKNKYKVAYQNYLDNNYLIYLNKCLKKIDELDDEQLSSKELTINKDGDKFLVDKNHNLEIFKAIKEKYNNPIYDYTPYIVKSREMKEEDFNNLSLKKQIDTLLNMIKILSRSNEQAKFETAFFENFTKVFLKTMTITNEKVYIVNESPSGLFKGKEELI